ncbi:MULTISPECIES: cyclic nucleotide-binding domain-containing protein [unclassified Minwuia]|jgi:CRP-like cAMP-binding protein|uniref:cyclic nucleotide-binding domain-containing protein n=1 Tax=unclassified Minwuia TaxID=2618799 RepID=UPI002479FF90|nr:MULTISPECIES: cyclic nucleotide-binding domain-containing protein [unclassified Minwuia]
MLKNSQEHVALISIYRVLAQSGIHPSTSHLDLHVRPAEIDLGEAALTPERLIEHVPIFAPLGEHGRSRLCDLVERRTFAPGEAVVKEGDIGDSMFLIAEGVVSIEVSAEGQEERMEVARLGPGEFFGEMALLTGDPRAATVVARDTTLTYEVTKAAIAPLMEGAQSLGAELSDVLAERQLKTASEREASRSYEEVKAEISKGLFGRIQNFFGRAPASAEKPSPTPEGAPSVRDHSGNGTDQQAAVVPPNGAASEIGATETPCKPAAPAEQTAEVKTPRKRTASVARTAKAKTTRTRAAPAEQAAKVKSPRKRAAPAEPAAKVRTPRKRAAPAARAAKVKTQREPAASAEQDAEGSLNSTEPVSAVAETQSIVEAKSSDDAVARLRRESKMNGKARNAQLNLSEVDENETTSSNENTQGP